MPNVLPQPVVGHGIYRRKPKCPHCYLSGGVGLCADDSSIRSSIRVYKMLNMLMKHIFRYYLQYGRPAAGLPTGWIWICRTCQSTPQFKTPAQSHFLSCPLCDGECEICRGRKFMRL